MQKFQNEVRQQGRLTEQDESFGALLGTLAGQSADLVRDEIILAKQEIREKVGSYQMALVLLLGGSVVGFLALFSFCTALIIWFGEKIGLGPAAALTGLGLTIIATIILSLGRMELRSLSLRPELTLKTLEENTEWLKKMN